MFKRNHRLALLTGIAVLSPLPATAQTSPAAADPAVAMAPQAATAGNRRVFTPADFARFAPKSAYDMLVQVPGFTIRGAVVERGLGQASENVLINGQRIANKSGGAIDELQKISASNVDATSALMSSPLTCRGARRRTAAGRCGCAD